MLEEFFNEITTDVDNKPYVYIPVIIILTLLIIWIINVIRFLIYRINRNIKASPFLIRGMIPGNQSYIIEQNPKFSSSIPILRSRNENDGIEFSYTVWLFVDDWINYKRGMWKSVFIKGNSSARPDENKESLDSLCSGIQDSNSNTTMIACPGLWFHPKDNSLRININTFDHMVNYLDIKNIPSNKWFCLAIVARHNQVDVYINGFLKKRLSLAGSIIRQNFSNVFINPSGGFSGKLSNLRYYDYAIGINDLMREVDSGPVTKTKTSPNYLSPPYLATNYWQNQYN